MIKSNRFHVLVLKKLHQIQSAGVFCHLHAAQLVCYYWCAVDLMLFLGILFMRTQYICVQRKVPHTQPPGYTIN